MKMTISRKRKAAKRVKRATRSVRSMAKKTKRKAKRRGKSSFGSSGGLFSGKILGMKIPLISGLIKNKNVQKAMVGAGTVATIGAIVGLVNNPTINGIWGNQAVRLGAAASTGDIIGAGTVFILENPAQLQGITNRVSGVAGGQQQISSQVGFA